MINEALIAGTAVCASVLGISFAEIVSKDSVCRLGRISPGWPKYREQVELTGIDIDLDWIVGLRTVITCVFGLLVLLCVVLQAKIGFLFLIAGIAAWKYLDFWFDQKEKQRQEDIEREFPLMVTLVRVYARASDLYQALMIVRDALQGEMRRQVEILAQELQVHSLQEALENFAARCRYPLLSNFVTVVLFGIKTGADVDEILASFARRAYEARVNTIKRKIKAQPIIISVLPAVLALSLLLLFVFPMYANIIAKLRAF